MIIDIWDLNPLKIQISTNSFYASTSSPYYMLLSAMSKWGRSKGDDCLSYAHNIVCFSTSANTESNFYHWVPIDAKGKFSNNTWGARDCRSAKGSDA